MNFRKIKTLFLTACLLCSLSLAQAAEGNMEVSADTLEYDSNSGIVVANGNVKMLKENATLTGAKATYNTKNQEATVSGGAHLIKEDIDLTSASLTSKNNDEIIAIGNVVMIKGETTITGPQVNYYSKQQYAVINSDATVNMKDSTMTANKLEAFLADNKVVGTGNVHLTSTAREIDAVGDVATYYGAKDQQGKIILEGNAKAVQKGNVLKGNKLTLFLADKTTSAEVVIKPE